MSPARDIESRLRTEYERSLRIVRDAHLRAKEAGDRAAAMRDRTRAARLAHAGAVEDPRKQVALLQLSAEESERSARERERFVAVLSHELRQALGAALAALAMLGRESAGEAAGRYRAVIERQLLQMARLLDDVADMSRIALRDMEMRPEAVAVAPLIRTLLDSVEAGARERPLSFRLAVPDEPVVVWGDPARLQQVFSNLLSNALHHTREGEISVVLSVEAPSAVVRVADTGDGISPADLERIFEPFARGSQGRPGGFGIGLALVRHLVELHGGRVRAESEGEGRGSVFIVTLPLHTL